MLNRLESMLHIELLGDSSWHLGSEYVYRFQINKSAYS